MTNPAHTAYAPTAFSFGMCTWLPARARRKVKVRMIRESATGAWAEMRASLAAAGSRIVR